MSEIYFNDVSILYKLRTNSPQAFYHSNLRPEIGTCQDVYIVPITFPFQESKISITVESAALPDATDFKFKFGFKTRNDTGILAHGTGFTEGNTTGFWEVHLHRIFSLFNL